MITIEDMIKTKITLLKQMDYYIINEIGDEECTDTWLEYGVPDEATEEDYREIAENESQWSSICTIFGDLIRQYGEEE